MTASTPRRTSAYAAVDLGATSGRVILGTLHPQGATVEEVHRFANTPLGEGASLRWDLDDLFAQTLDGLAAAIATCTRRGHRLAGIGVDAWGVDFVQVGEHGEPRGPASHYRAPVDLDAVLSRRTMSPTEAFAIAGVPDHPINSANRLAASPAAGRTLFIPDYWVHALTGAQGTDRSIASTSQLLDARSGEWSLDLTRAFGIDETTLPPLQAVGSIAGWTTEVITARLGAAEPIPVVRVLGHDTASAFAIAQPAPATSSASSSTSGLIATGTWSVVGVGLARPVTTSEALAAGFTNERGLDSVLLLRNLTGLWILEQCRRDWRHDGIPVPDIGELVALAEAAGDGPPAGFDVGDPALASDGRMLERVERACRQAGIPVDPRDPARVARVIFDSLALAYTDTLRGAERLAGTRIDGVRMGGGGAQNRYLCQLTADLLGLPVIAGPVEASAVGNLAVQAVADGRFREVREAYAAFAASEAVTTYSPGSPRPAASTPEEPR